MNTELLKCVGFILMIIDHVGYLFFPDLIFLRMVGRLCAPMFFYLLVIGFNRSKNVPQYLYRLICGGLISQFVIIYFNVFNGEFKVNILLTLAWCLLCLALIDRYPKFKPWIILGFSIVASLARFEYGWYAVLSVVLFKGYSKSREWLICWGLLHAIALLDPRLNYLQLFALPAPVLISYLSRLSFKIPRLPWVFWYGLYPVQWVVLSLMS